MQLDILRPRVLPLLTSPFVGSGAAFDCCRELAACLPGGELPSAALPIACSLRLVMLTEKEGEAADWQHLSQRQCVAEAVGALQAATGGRPGEDGAVPPPALRRPLPGAAYMFCFPILRAVMRWGWAWCLCVYSRKSRAAATCAQLQLLLLQRPLATALWALTRSLLRPCLLRSCPEPTPLHEAALGVVALHVGPSAK